MSLRRAIKATLQNISLLVCTILVGYALVEGGLRLALHHLPMGFFNVQCRELKTLGQTSKRGLVPIAPYIAIVGDSYGAGKGDWFAANKYNLNSRFQAAHILQDETGLDIVSFSKAGAGSLDGVLYALNTFATLKGYGFGYPEPERIFLYFYEGNDVRDNLRLYEKYFLPLYPEGAISDIATRTSFAQKLADAHVTGTLPAFENRFFAGNCLIRALEMLHYSLRAAKPSVPSGTLIGARVGEKEVFLPDFLTNESPLAYKKEQLERAALVFDAGLALLQKYWPDSKVQIVFIPAPLACYQMEYPALDERIQHTHDALVAMLQEVAISRSVDFLDTTPVIQEAARKEFTHGPTDWSHLNRAGYHALAAALLNSDFLDGFPKTR